MPGPSQNLNGPQYVLGDPCPPEISMGNLRSAPKPQCQTPGSPTTSTQALPSFECSVCEERSRGRWVLTCCGVGSTFQLTKCSAAGLPSTQAGCSIGWCPPKGGHTPGGDGSSSCRTGFLLMRSSTSCLSLAEIDHGGNQLYQPPCAWATSNQDTTLSCHLCSLLLLPAGLRPQQNSGISGWRNAKVICSPLTSFS